MDFNNMKDFGFEDLNVRKSVFDMQVITLDTPYLGGLPPELENSTIIFLMKDTFSWSFREII